METSWKPTEIAGYVDIEAGGSASHGSLGGGSAADPGNETKRPHIVLDNQAVDIRHVRWNSLEPVLVASGSSSWSSLSVAVAATAGIPDRWDVRLVPDTSSHGEQEIIRVCITTPHGRGFRIHELGMPVSLADITEVVRRLGTSLDQYIEVAGPIAHEWLDLIPYMDARGQEAIDVEEEALYEDEIRLSDWGWWNGAGGCIAGVRIEELYSQSGSEVWLAYPVTPGVIRSLAKALTDLEHWVVEEVRGMVSGGLVEYDDYVVDKTEPWRADGKVGNIVPSLVRAALVREGIFSSVYLETFTDDEIESGNIGAYEADRAWYVELWVEEHMQKLRGSLPISLAEQLPRSLPIIQTVLRYSEYPDKKVEDRWERQELSRPESNAGREAPDAQITAAGFAQSSAAGDAGHFDGDVEPVQLHSRLEKAETVHSAALDDASQAERNLTRWRDLPVPGEQGLFRGVALICSIMVLGALLPWPYAYYEVLRWVVFLGGGVMALLGAQLTEGAAYNSRRWQTFMVPFLVAVAILFNPLIPIGMSRESWAVPDFTVGLALISVALIDFRIGSRTDEGDEPDEESTWFVSVKGASQFAMSMAVLGVGAALTYASN